MLIYHEDRAPSGLRDTDEIALEVCVKEGLQQIIWISKPLSAEEAEESYRSVYEEGVRRYGQAEEDPVTSAVSWPAGRTMAAEFTTHPGVHRILMVSHGPNFEACSEEHRRMTGHSADEHWRWPLSHSGENGSDID